MLRLSGAELYKERRLNIYSYKWSSLNRNAKQFSLGSHLLDGSTFLKTFPLVQNKLAYICTVVTGAAGCIYLEHSSTLDCSSVIILAAKLRFKQLLFQLQSIKKETLSKYFLKFSLS